LFRLEPDGEDAFRAQLPGFGGITLGCATRAAAGTTPFALHSLHVYFLRAVPIDRPVRMHVVRVRDGRRLAHRRVEVLDDDKLCCEQIASFAAPGRGAEYQEPSDAPRVPAPEELPDEEQIERQDGWLPRKGPIGAALEWRFIGGAPWKAADESRYQAWLRPRLPVPDEPALQVAALAFLADMHSHLTVARRLGAHFEPAGYTSLDQTLWVHRDEPWTDWRLLRCVSDLAHAGRAFTRRSLHARDGRLIASMAQEQLVPIGAEE
jgi:acyl-CoA thioesterase-2